jgi:hypothetical protein
MKKKKGGFCSMPWLSFKYDFSRIDWVQSPTSHSDLSRRIAAPGSPSQRKGRDPAERLVKVALIGYQRLARLRRRVKGTAVPECS